MTLELGFSASDYSSIVSINIFVALLSACIIIGHLLEENRWMNESVTALLIEGSSLRTEWYPQRIFTYWYTMGQGLCTGGVILLTTQGKNSKILVFSEDLFFIYLLPPIIFNAGFQVKKKQFFRNFMTIVLFGAVGTLVSFVIISLGSMKLFQWLGIEALEIGDFLAIGAIFSATDSVCTLQVLNQDETPLLYSLVFGEGVVNDATSVVLFNALQTLDLGHFDSSTIFKFIGNFLYLFGTSTFLGVFTGLFSAYIIKTLYFGRHSTDREVAIMILMAYLSYMLAELLDLSGILTVFFCGIVMSHYTWHNVTESSRITTKHTFATLSFIAEIFIFLYVGMDALDIEKWRISSPVRSISISSIIVFVVMVGRAAFVFPLSYLSNVSKKTGSQKITFREQVVIWWAGLMRGAVSIALAYSKFTTWGHTQLPSNAIMITSTIIVVLFSTLVFGILTKPLVHFLLPKRDLTRQLSISSDPPTPKSFGTPLLNNGQASSEAEPAPEYADPPSPKSIRTPLLNNGEASPETEPTQETSQSIRRPSSLRMFLTIPTRSVHHYWRKFDDAVMRPVFGGRGFMPVVPGSPTDRSVHNGELV